MTQVMLSFYLTNHYMKQRIKRYCALIAPFLFQFAFYFGYISQTKNLPSLENQYLHTLFYLAVYLIYCLYI